MAEPKPARVVTVGEVLIELSRRDGKTALGCGGDTFNTAVYLARAGVDVAFATALGDDSYSDAILSLPGTEGISCNLVRRVANRLPGIYLVEQEANGRRRFYHWRG